ncbi:MAG: folate-binding protein YgfZ, partial [Alphaproteobacteria bacterium]|nr:folate-binding protein YgfZ [Alphaproteobacteria bacterium]
SGPDARGFLQGLVTNDIEKLKPGRALYAALLSPQGKILFDFLLAEGDGAILIDCTAASRDSLIKRLAMYRLRAKVQIEPREQLAVLAGFEAPPSERGVVFEDPRLAALGFRTIGARAELPAPAHASSSYHDRRLQLGVPEGADFGLERIFALDGGLDELRAVDFEKGCYVGQELTARMKHRGTARKRLLPVEGPQGLAADVELRAGAHMIGEVVSVYGKRGFALVRLDRLEEAAGSPIEANGVGVSVTKPSWL